MLLGGGPYFSWLWSTYLWGQHYVPSQHTMCQWLQMLLLWQNKRSTDPWGCNLSRCNCSCYGTLSTIYSVFLPDGKELSRACRGFALCCFQSLMFTWQVPNLPLQDARLNSERSGWCRSWLGPDTKPLNWINVHCYCLSLRRREHFWLIQNHFSNLTDFLGRI